MTIGIGPIGRRTIRFKHARPEGNGGILRGKFAFVVQALRHLDKEGEGVRDIERLRALLPPADEPRFVKDTRFGVDWIYESAKRIAEKVG